MIMDRELKKAILEEFLNRETHRISRSMLLRKMWMHCESGNQLDDVMSQFCAAGMIDKEIVYIMPQKQVDELTRLYTNMKSQMK
jgi:hypothetical protein